MTPCLSEDTVLDFLGGTLSQDEREAVEAHVDACVPCSKWLTQAMRVVAGTSQETVLAGRTVVDDLSELETRHEFTREEPTPCPARFRGGDLCAGRFRIERWVSEGGMGVVYRARHVEIGREVAIKVLERSHPIFRHSFQS